LFFVSKTFGFCIFFILISLLSLIIVFFIELLEKQEIVMPHLLLQKCNNKLPQNKIFLHSSTVYIEGHM